MKMNEDKDKIDDLYELVKGGMEIIEEHEDKIDRLFSGSKKIEVGEGEPLKDLTKTEDEVKITIETQNELDTISMARRESGVVIDIGEMDVIAKTPSDVNLDGVEANLSNGVLDITIPRGEE